MNIPVRGPALRRIIQVWNRLFQKHYIVSHFKTGPTKEKLTDDSSRRVSFRVELNDRQLLLGVFSIEVITAFDYVPSSVTRLR